MSAAFDFLCVLKFDGGRHEFSACGDHKPKDRPSEYFYNSGPTWWFTPRRSDLPDSEWDEIKYIVETTRGEWAPHEPDRLSWCLMRDANDKWILCPF